MIRIAALVLRKQIIVRWKINVSYMPSFQRVPISFENSTGSSEMVYIMTATSYCWIERLYIAFGNRDTWCFSRPTSGSFEGYLCNTNFTDTWFIRFIHPEAAIRSSHIEVFFRKKVLWKHAANLQENTHVKVWFQ